MGLSQSSQDSRAVNIMRFGCVSRLGMGSTMAFAALVLSVIAANVDGHNSQISGFRCLLRGSAETECNTLDTYVPERLLEIYNNLSSKAKEQLSARNITGLTPEDLANLPPALIYLIPTDFLEAASGRGLALLMQRRREDPTLAVKIISALRDPDQHAQFFDELVGTQLPVETQIMFGKVLALWWPDPAKDWPFNTFQKTIRNGSPLAAYIAPGIIFPMKNKVAEKFLYHLRSWHRATLRSWADNPKVVRRAWARLAVHGPYTVWEPADLKGFEFLLIGATANELSQLLYHKIETPQTIINSTLDKLEARALFHALYGAETLTGANLTEFLPLALQLSPRELQQFNPNATDFRRLRFITPERRTSSFAADKQILESLKAQAALASPDFSANSGALHVGIRDLGPFVHVMPSRDLHVQWSKRLGPNAYHAIDSDKLSREQALALTNNSESINLRRPTSVLGLRGLLRALYTGRVVGYPVGELPQNVLNHLAFNLPRCRPALSAAVLHKLRPQLGDLKILEYMLSNKHPEQFFELMSSMEVKSLSSQILKAFKILHEDGFARNIKKLPHNMLSTLLEASKRKPGCWDPEELKEHAAFLGLSCITMSEVDEVDVVDVLARYQRELKDAGKRFPKTLQYCGQLMTMRYIAMKSFFRQTPDKETRLDVLDPSEIQAIGGFVLASLPPELIQSASVRTEILQTIAQLSLPELMEATGRRDYLLKFTKYLVNDLIGQKSKLDIDDLLSLGSLMNFIPAVDKIVDPAAFRFVVEAIEDPRSKTLCANFDTRKLWFKLIERAFGSPDKWTAGDLGLLADYLLAVPSHVLDLVPAKKWSEAIDSLVEQTSYHLEITWPGWDAPVSFVQACGRLMTHADEEEYQAAVSNLLHRYLIASQTQLDSIESAGSLIDSVQHKQSMTRVVPGMHIGQQPASIAVLTLTSRASSKTTTAANATTPNPAANATTSEPKAVANATTFEPIATTLEPTAVANATTMQQLTVTAASASTTPDIVDVTSTEEVLSEEKALMKKTSTEISSSSTERSSSSTEKSASETVASTERVVSVENPATTEQVTVEMIETSTENSSMAMCSDLLCPMTMVSDDVTPESTSEAAFILTEDSEVTTMTLTTVEDAATALRETGTTVHEVFELNATATTGESEAWNKTVGNGPDSESKTLDLAIEHHHLSHLSINESTDFIHSEKSQRSKRDDDSDEGEKVEIFVNVKAIPASDAKLVKKLSKIPEKPVLKIDNDNRIRKKVSCDAIRALGRSAVLALEWRDLDLMDGQELEDCLEFFGTLGMSHEIYMKIWARVDRATLLSSVASLGHLTQAMEFKDVQALNLNLTAPGTIDLLGALGSHIRHARLLEALAQRVSEQNAGASNVGPAALVALGRIACDLPLFTLRQLAGADLALAAPAWGRTIAGCPAACLDAFARLATEEAAFGDAAFWTASDLAALGKIPAGLLAQQWASVNESAMSGVDASAVRCIPPIVFKELPRSHLANLSPTAASVVTEEQMSLLHVDQKTTLLRVRDLDPVPIKLLIHESGPSPVSAAICLRRGGRVLAVSVIVAVSTMFLHFLMF